MKDRVIVHKDKVVLTLLSSVSIGGQGPAAGLIMNYRQCLDLIKILIQAAGEAKSYTPKDDPQSTSPNQVAAKILQKGG